MLVTLAGGFGAVLPALELPFSNFQLIGLDQLDPDGVGVATRGLVVRIGDRQLIADAGRYDQANNDLFATGHIVYRQPGVRIAASRIGLHLPPGHRDATDLSGVRGDLWDVEAQITTPERTLRIHAARMSLADEALTFHDVDLDFGHGGIIAFSASKAVVTMRRPKPGEDPKEARSHVDGVTLVSPTGSVVSLPVLWFPYLYRDFSHRYPWTKVRAGHTRRLGTYGKFWIGSGLPAMGDWHTGLDGLVSDNSIAGRGYGLRPYWRHDQFGRGDAEWYVMPSEAVRGGPDDKTELQVRRSQAFDAGHYTNLGAGAFAARYARVPDGDVPGTSPSYRYLQDYLPERLEHDPFPRQGAALVYSFPGLTTTVDTERRINPTQVTTERFFGLQAIVHPVAIAGPLHAAGDTWVENLHQVSAETDATRLNSRVYATAGYWFPGGIGADADVGVKELRYADGEIAGVEQDDAARRALVSAAGLKLRLEGSFDSLKHLFVPRVGIQITGQGEGDPLPAYGFDDGRDTFDEDARYYVAGFETSLVNSRTLFHANVTSRWAMRTQDRAYVDASGITQLSPQRLKDVVGYADGRPWEPLYLTASFTYDAGPRQWTAFNTSAAWRLAPFLTLNEVSTLIPTTNEWANTPGLAVTANRYRYDASTTFRPGGAAVDSWLIEITRRMVDGDLFLGYQFVRDESGVVSDRRISIGFTLGGSATPLSDAPPAAKTSLSL
jgi:hypothetical protein